MVTAAIANYKGILPCFLLGVMLTLFSSMLNAFINFRYLAAKLPHLQIHVAGSIRIRKQSAYSASFSNNLLRDLRLR
jgi:hypothetical protein